MTKKKTRELHTIHQIREAILVEPDIIAVKSEPPLTEKHSEHSPDELSKILNLRQISPSSEEANTGD